MGGATIEHMFAKSRGKRPGPVAQHWPVLLMLLVGIALLVGVWLTRAGDAIDKFFDTASVVFGLVFGAYQYAYRRITGFRLGIDRFKAWATNASSQWSLIAEFPVTDAAVALEQASEALATFKAKGDKVVSEAPGHVVWSLRGLVIKASATSYQDPVEGDRQQVRIEVPPVAQSFREWRHFIEEAAIPLTEAAQTSMAKYLDGPAKFAAEIRFRGANPYFGLWIANIRPEFVGRFDVEYAQELASTQSHVRVGRDRVGLVAPTLQAISVGSRMYLGLSGGVGKA